MGLADSHLGGACCRHCAHNFPGYGRRIFRPAFLSDDYVSPRCVCRPDIVFVCWYCSGSFGFCFAIRRDAGVYGISMVCFYPFDEQV